VAIENKKEIENLLTKVKKIQKENKLDLSSDEDLSVAVMNLIGIEEHLFFTATKTKKIKYLNILNQVRQMRVKLLKKLIKDYEGEVWCLSKHLLAASMRLNEVGTKYLNKGKQKEAWEFFQMAYQLYSLFWGVNLRLIDSQSIKANLTKLGFKENEFIDSEKITTSKNNNFFNKLGDLVKKVVDCCWE